GALSPHGRKRIWTRTRATSVMLHLATRTISCATTSRASAPSIGPALLPRKRPALLDQSLSVQLALSRCCSAARAAASSPENPALAHLSAGFHSLCTLPDSRLTFFNLCYTLLVDIYAFPIETINPVF